ncbi:LADA_0B04456g1_1 [Lachancea dasiensis]|uniref:LADA_0B04456g1_1 n=1 Tax=Lachancea dasiensis TaxID=1072105 RepID=A0A1G4ISZ7_9SACH|nr:LADA_0B04456g1_1 [Lachancea dasiensis]
MEGKGAEEHLISSAQSSDAHKIPRDVFRSKLRWFCTRHRLVLSVLGVELGLALLCAQFAIQSQLETEDRALVLVVIGLLVIIFGLLSFAIAHGAIVSRSHARTNKIAFMREIIRAKPGIDASSWDTIAATINPIFYASSSSLTPYFFYDGEACYNYFRNTYLQPYLRRMERSSKNEGSPTNQMQPIDDLQPFIDRAIRVYEEQANRDFQDLLGEGSSWENEEIHNPA